MQKANSRKLAASVALAVASVALLLGLTFAWFTDSVKNEGNRIQAGTLGIAATVADVEAGKADFTVAGVNGGNAFGFSADARDLEAEGVQVIAEDNWEPGQSDAKLLTVSNDGTLATKVKLQFDVRDAGLQDALWFDFIQVKDGQVAGQFTERPMGQLATVAENLEVKLAAGESIQFILVYGMDESAGNEYQGKSFEADATVLATQDTVEADGFGNTGYDSGATYPVTIDSSGMSLDDIAAALEDPNATVELNVTESVGELTNRLPKMDIKGNATINIPDLGNGGSFDADVYISGLTVSDGGTLVVNGEWVSGGSVSDLAVLGPLTVTGSGSTVTLNSIHSTGQSGYQGAGFVAKDGGVLNLNGGYYGTSGASGCAVLADGGTVVIAEGSYFSASGAGSNAFKAVNGGKIIVAKSVYESTRINGSKIPSTNQAVLDGDNYIITEIA